MQKEVCKMSEHIQTIVRNLSAYKSTYSTRFGAMKSVLDNSGSDNQTNNLGNSNTLLSHDQLNISSGALKAYSENFAGLELVSGERDLQSLQGIYQETHNALKGLDNLLAIIDNNLGSSNGSMSLNKIESGVNPESPINNPILANELLECCKTDILLNPANALLAQANQISPSALQLLK